ncbi:hypothetical protein TSTA_030470 [Talaromyces stipitatus ATCC 10500]|uniref:Uncharacterized protein n=1 Tax=Talaromyces stipitatus (strain ATCC 10500 / CBS 375.48 / QM 6759 / NRRL 1006) TaxID=441959 RepID=B8M5H5_TALSN|nr:uncharacterized protein TSTA_030470 [Talaromyces stipitatus ATCC 10500]EED19781.1 hypothetical protein TSTA_030470 [Talaromyces stipitatus ATCC 10500]
MFYQPGVTDHGLAHAPFEVYMNLCYQLVGYQPEAVPYGVDEFERVSQYISNEPATLINAPMAKESPVKFACGYHFAVRLPGNPPMGTVNIVFGKVIAVCIQDEGLTEGIRSLGQRETTQA